MTEKNQKYTTMYHFTSTIGWKGMNEGKPDILYSDPKTGELIEGEQIRGLWPERRLIPIGIESSLVPHEATKPTIFSFLEEKPKSWIEYTHFSLNLFDFLLAHCAKYSEDKIRNIVLLKIDLIPEDDPYVIEYQHMTDLNNNYEKIDNKKEREKNKNRMIAEANKKYWESRTPLREYNGNFTLPEIIITTPIPLERIHFIWKKELYDYLSEVHR